MINKIFLNLVVLGIFLASTGGETIAATVIFDKGHGERFLMEKSGQLDFSEMQKILRAAGVDVRNLEAALSDETLASADALIISGPFNPIRPEEAEAVMRFMQRGGRLAVMLHIGSPASELLHRLEVDVTNTVVHEQENVIGNQSTNFSVVRLTPHPLFKDVQRFGFYGGWGLSPAGNGGIIAATGAEAWADLDGDRRLSAADAVQEFGVVVSGKIGSGEFVIFGDDAIFQNKFLTDGNRRLGENLGTWLGRQ